MYFFEKSLSGKETKLKFVDWISKGLIPAVLVPVTSYNVHTSAFSLKALKHSIENDGTLEVVKHRKLCFHYSVYSKKMSQTCGCFGANSTCLGGAEEKKNSGAQVEIILETYGNVAKYVYCNMHFCYHIQFLTNSVI